MSCPELPYLTDSSLNEIMQYSFEAFLRPLAAQFHSVSAEETRKIDSDFESSISSEIRRALDGRYPLCRKLRDDFERWDSNRIYINTTRIQNEPCVVAAAVALRPSEYWQWHLVEKWSWVYRHALMLDVPVDDFAEWCKLQDPNISRHFIVTLPTWLAPLSDQGASAISDAAHGNA